MLLAMMTVQGIARSSLAISTLIILLFHRLSYFTSGNTSYRKTDFVKELSASFCLVYLTCSFSDKEIAEYFQHKKRKAGLLPLKYAVSHTGLQEDGSWVLGSNAYLKGNSS